MNDIQVQYYYINDCSRCGRFDKEWEKIVNELSIYNINTEKINAIDILSNLHTINFDLSFVPEIKIKNPDPKKIQIIYFDMGINHGKKELITAPPAKATTTVGKTQHSNVPVEPSKAKKLIKLSFILSPKKSNNKMYRI